MSDDLGQQCRTIWARNVARFWPTSDAETFLAD
ncbi:unnamed protein product, partial [Allacma fusca]